MSRTNLRDSIRPGMLAAGTKAKIIARNTFRFTAPDGATVTRLHQTDIVRALPGGRFQLDSKGWRTVTTKDRMATVIVAAGYRMWSNKGSWYVGTGQPDVPAVPYYDGMILPDAFKAPAKGAAAEKKEQSTRKAIKLFCDKLDKMPELPAPSNGDCWLCCMKDKAGQSMGEMGGTDSDREHLRTHLKEGYLHGSLILNALQFAGYGDVSLIWHMENRDRKEGRKSTWAKRALRKYLYRKLGLVA